MAISIHELYKPEQQLTEDQQLNLHHLHYKVNVIRAACGFPLVINRGFSTIQEQISIYAGINAEREKQKLKPLSVPYGSQHLSGAAVDIADADQKLHHWTLEHLELFEELLIFIEEPETTRTWMHFQIYPYASWTPGKSMIFQPY